MSNIVHRTVEKDEKLATLRDHRDHVNACKSLERKLDLDLKREKVQHVFLVAVLCVRILRPYCLRWCQDGCTLSFEYKPTRAYNMTWNATYESEACVMLAYCAHHN